MCDLCEGYLDPEDPAVSTFHVATAPAGTGILRSGPSEEKSMEVHLCQVCVSTVIEFSRHRKKPMECERI